MCVLLSAPPADVNFWVNGGWQQPNCGITVNPLFVLAVSQLLNAEGEKCIAEINEGFVIVLQIVKHF
jgi:hypothetical protein